LFSYFRLKLDIIAFYLPVVSSEFLILSLFLKSARVESHQSPFIQPLGYHFYVKIICHILKKDYCVNPFEFTIGSCFLKVIQMAFLNSALSIDFKARMMLLSEIIAL